MEVEETPQFKYWLERMSSGREIRANHDGNIIEVKLIGRLKT